MAEDDRAVAEGSASWGLQGGMGLHLCGGGLQPSPHAESDDASAVSQRQAVLEKDLQAAADATKTLPLSRKSRNLASILSRAVVFPQPAIEFFRSNAIAELEKVGETVTVSCDPIVRL